MIIKETKDKKEIMSVLGDPDIFPKIAYGLDIKPDDFIPPDDALYLAGYDPELIGVSCIHEFKDGVKFHPNVLKSYRLKYALDFCLLCLSMIKGKIYAEVPSFNQKAVNFAKKLGFVELSKADTVLLRLL
jgi:hypothetical protein